MPRIPAGEMNVSEIRNLVRQHNKLSVIDNVAKKSRTQLIQEITDMGYNIDHSKKMITKVRLRKGQKNLSVSDAGDTKQQTKKKVKAKARSNLKKKGTAPVMVADRGEDEI
jgi:hypothetical protein